MKDIIIGACQGTSLISKAIQLFQRGYPYTHVFWVSNEFIHDPSNDIPNEFIQYSYHSYKLTKKKKVDKVFYLKNLNIIEPLPYYKGRSGVLYNHTHFYTEDNKHIKNVILLWLRVQDYQYELITNFVYNQVHKKYDFLGIINFIIPFVSDLNDRKRWFCSELISAAFRYAHINYWGKYQPHQLDIKHFLIPMIQHAYKILIIPNIYYGE